jgi:hypothetical protein
LKRAKIVLVTVIFLLAALCLFLWWNGLGTRWAVFAAINFAAGLWYLAGERSEQS